MSYADPSDVAVELGRSPSSASEAEQWQAWLDRAERAIAREFRRAGFDLMVQVGRGEPLAEEVRDVAVAAVVRKIQNPNWGETSYTKSLDDGSVTRRREGAEGDPLALLPDEIAGLLPTRPSGAFSTRPGFMPDCGDFYLHGW